MDTSVTMQFEHVDKISFTFENSGESDRSILFAGKICPTCGNSRDSELGPDGQPKAKSQCDAGPETDCVLSHWSAWGGCSATCDGGQQDRTRTVLMEPTGRGKLCDAFLSEMTPCNTQHCLRKCVAVDCGWSQWTEWSACTKCAGQKRRTRWVVKEPACGGNACHLENTEETAECPRWCEATHMFCAWADWDSWSRCTATCGKALKTRVRNLKATVVDMQTQSALAGQYLGRSDLEGDLEKLNARERRGEVRRVQELTLAFGSGCIAFMAFMAIHRVFTKPRRQFQPGEGYQQVVSLSHAS